VADGEGRAPSRAPRGSPRPRHGNKSSTRPVPFPRPAEPVPVGRGARHPLVYAAARSTAYKKNVGACVRLPGPFPVGVPSRLAGRPARHPARSSGVVVRARTRSARRGVLAGLAPGTGTGTGARLIATGDVDHRGASVSCPVAGRPVAGHERGEAWERQWP
jgi:hypothetical protein